MIATTKIVTTNSWNGNSGTPLPLEVEDVRLELVETAGEGTTTWVDAEPFKPLLSVAVTVTV